MQQLHHLVTTPNDVCIQDVQVSFFFFFFYTRRKCRCVGHLYLYQWLTLRMYYLDLDRKALSPIQTSGHLQYCILKFHRPHNRPFLGATVLIGLNRHHFWIWYLVLSSWQICIALVFLKMLQLKNSLMGIMTFILLLPTHVIKFPPAERSNKVHFW